MISDNIRNPLTPEDDATRKDDGVEERAFADSVREERILKDQSDVERQGARLQSDEAFDDEEFAESADDDTSDDDDTEVLIYDAEAEDRAEQTALQAQIKAGMKVDDDQNASPRFVEENSEDNLSDGVRNMAEMMAVIESLVFVSEEPLPVRAIAEVLEEERGWVEIAVQELAKEFNERGGGIWLREVAGGWQFATRPEHHEYIRAYLKSRPSAKLSLAALETLAVIAYKQPITVPEILEIRGVQSSSAIKTLLDKRLIIVKGRKETIGRPMMYGTSKEFLLQFGLRDLSELPSIEDFEDLTSNVA